MRIHCRRRCQKLGGEFLTEKSDERAVKVGEERGVWVERIEAYSGNGPEAERVSHLRQHCLRVPNLGRKVEQIICHLFQSLPNLLLLRLLTGMLTGLLWVLFRKDSRLLNARSDTGLDIRKQLAHLLRQRADVV